MDIEQRRRWMAMLARAPLDRLDDAWQRLDPRPDYRLLRAPEVGMVMVRGRAGGVGERFNLGEMTVTRCAVQINQGAEGYAYIAGTDRRRAELAAVFDGLMQDPVRRPALEESLIEPLAAETEAARAARRAEAAATRVEFFTMVRGD